MLTLEDAVRKMTSLPAGILGLSDRGQLREGFAADIASSTRRACANESFEKPKSYAEGVPYVLVNGVVIMDKARVSTVPAGKPFASPRWKAGPTNLHQQGMTERHGMTLDGCVSAVSPCFRVKLASAASSEQTTEHRRAARDGEMLRVQPLSRVREFDHRRQPCRPILTGHQGPTRPRYLES